MAESGYITTKVDYKYEDYWVPPRCRKPRVRLLDGSYEARVKVFDDAPLVATIHERRWVYEESGERPDFRMVDTPVYKARGRFFEPSMANDLCSSASGETTVDMLLQHIASPLGWKESYPTRGIAEETIRRHCDQWLIVGGKVCQETEQAVYSIRRMGLGHNHGGTCYTIDRGYNSNISARDYFNANDIEDMFDRFFSVALGRGDTDSARWVAQDLATGDYERIDVRVPEAFDADPLTDAGDGDPFMNRLYDLTDTAQSSAEAGVLVLAATISGMNGGDR